MTAPAKSTRLVALAAGGTGGHMFPAAALARELLSRGIRVALLTDRRGGGFGPELPEVETFRLAAGGIAGGSPWSKLKSAAKLAWGYLQARRILKRSGAEAVVGFGGYASLPGVLAGSHLGLRTLLHEQNAVMGRANRLAAGKADILATSFAEVAAVAEADRAKIAVTGNPVRAAIAALHKKPYALPSNGGALRLLVVGGSQGARVFNEIMPKAICLLPDALRGRIKLAQQVRGNDLEEMRATYTACGVHPELQPFFDDVPERLKAAHLVISRSGASTVAELAAAGRPAIMVPYPFATDDHQTANAEALAKAGGGWVMQQRDLTPELLADKLRALLEHPTALADAASAARGFARMNAAQKLADLIVGETPGNGLSKRGEAAA
ncbi:MAG: undecaprenyldiphospho-muramoylpentapeptide beta-N-acetylglucosaminyltransferase [Rhodovibrionaceae bacterium]